MVKGSRLRVKGSNRMRKCVNALVSSRNANATSSWGDGDLADGVFIKIFFQFQKKLYFCISKKWMYNHKIETQ